MTVDVIGNDKITTSHFLRTWILDQSGASRNLLHSTTILLIISRKFSLSMKHGSNQLTLTILLHLWHLLVIQSCSLLVSLVKVVVLLSFFDHSWNSNFSALATYLHLNLSNLWLLNFQLATRKPSFLTSIALHLPKSLSFLTNSRIYSKFLFHHQWWLQYPFWSNYSWQIFWHPWQFSSYTAHQLSNSRWWSHPWSSHHTIQLYCYHTPFSPWILPVRSQIFHIQILPTHTPYNSTSYHPIPFLQYHWCWQFQKWHPHFPSLHKPSLQCLRPCRSIFLHPQIHSRHPCPNQIQNCCPKKRWERA